MMHERTHKDVENLTKQSVIDILGRPFTQKEQQQMFVRVNRPGYLCPYLCLVCEKNLQGKYNMKIHVRSHTGELPFTCQYCPRKFGSIANRNKHQKTHFEQEKPYQCSFCSKMFVRKEHCNRHEKIHKGIKPYECVHCKKTFSQKQEMETHVRVHHTGEKPFQCQFCAKTFAQKTECNKHIKAIHKGEID